MVDDIASEAADPSQPAAEAQAGRSRVVASILLGWNTVSDVIQHFLFPPHHNHDSATRPSPYGPQSRSPFVQQFCAKRGMASDELVAWSMRKNEAKFTSAPEPQVFLSHVRESDKVRWK